MQTFKTPCVHVIKKDLVYEPGKQDLLRYLGDAGIIT